jgi:hypothetical protein
MESLTLRGGKFITRLRGVAVRKAVGILNSGKAENTKFI